MTKPSPRIERRIRSDRVNLTRDAAKIEETPDYWIIPDTVLTRDGVMNGGRKIREDLAQTWLLADGIPFTHEHPGEDELGLVIDMRRIGGFVTNVRFEDESGEVVGDVYLLKQPQPGLQVTEENVRRNKRLVDSLRAGNQEEVSIGFWSTDEFLWEPQEHNGMRYDRIQREIKYDHLASVPMGACSWEQGCGLGRAQRETDHAHSAAAGESPRGAQGDESMPEPNADCKDKDELQRRLKDADAKADAATKAAKDAADRFAALESKLNTTLGTLNAFVEREEKATRARVDAKRTELAMVLAKKPDELPAGLDEAALDMWLAREREYRGRADGTPLRGISMASGDEAVKDGVLVHEGGVTVTDWTKLPSRAGVN